MTDWNAITVVDGRKIRGKPPNWFPAAESLVSVGVPVGVARRWKKVRYDMTTGLRRRVKRDKN